LVFLELLEGAKEGAFGAALVEGEALEVLAMARVDVGEAGGGGQMAVVILEIFGQIVVAEVEVAGFELADAAEAPGGGNEVIGERGFDGVEGWRWSRKASRNSRKAGASSSGTTRSWAVRPCWRPL